MTNFESRFGIFPSPGSGNNWNFAEGSRIIREGDVVYIYDPSGEKRWELHDFLTDNDTIRKRRFALQGVTYGGTWHNLMTVYEDISVETSQPNDITIGVTVITGDTDYVGDVSTSSHAYFYDQDRDGRLMEGWGGGYYGERTVIEENLAEMHALAITPDQLPPIIDVPATAAALAEAFNQGSFEPPQFVLPAAQLAPPKGFISRMVDKLLHQ